MKAGRVVISLAMVSAFALFGVSVSPSRAMKGTVSKTTKRSNPDSYYFHNGGKQLFGSLDLSARFKNDRTAKGESKNNKNRKKNLKRRNHKNGQQALDTTHDDRTNHRIVLDPDGYMIWGGRLF